MVDLGDDPVYGRVRGWETEVNPITSRFCAGHMPKGLLPWLRRLSIWILLAGVGGCQAGLVRLPLSRVSLTLNSTPNLGSNSVTTILPSMMSTATSDTTALLATAIAKAMARSTTSCSASTCLERRHHWGNFTNEPYPPCDKFHRPINCPRPPMNPKNGTSATSSGASSASTAKLSSLSSGEKVLRTESSISA